MSRKARIPPASQTHLKALLAAHSGLEHLEVEPWGKTLKLNSRSPHGPETHAKLTWLGGPLWGLSLPTRTGRWQKTPFIGPMEQVFEQLLQMLGFHLSPR